jgi:hypothetical protein
MCGLARDSRRAKAVMTSAQRRPLSLVVASTSRGVFLARHLTFLRGEPAQITRAARL